MRSLPSSGFRIVDNELPILGARHDDIGYVWVAHHPRDYLGFRWVKFFTDFVAKWRHEFAAFERLRFWLEHFGFPVFQVRKTNTGKRERG